MWPVLIFVNRQGQQERFGFRRILEEGQRGRFSGGDMWPTGLEEQAPFPFLNMGFWIENVDGPEMMQEFLFEIPQSLFV